MNVETDNENVYPSGLHIHEIMRVSVVVCEHTMERYDDLREAADSVLAQSHDDTELVLVSDGSDAVCHRMREDFSSQAIVECLADNEGLLSARNEGVRAATGDIVAFLDDDAVASEEWIEELVSVYTARDIPAVGGKMVPKWVADKPTFLPEEFYWLIGVTQPGFAEGPGEVRNTFGSNLSFRRDVFLDLGGFDPDLGGRRGDANLQGGETELCSRMRDRYGHGVYYNPAAVVTHKVFDYRTRLRWLLDRAFWQGYSKRGMAVMVPGSTGTETAFLGDLVRRFVPRRLRSLVSRPSLRELIQLVAVVGLTTAVGLGYLYGMLAYPPWTGKSDT